jgi:hypothetical protein
MLLKSESEERTTNLPSAKSKGLDWAFAGTSSTLQSPVPGDESEIVEWKHWIDSRAQDKAFKTDGIKDVGRCFPQPNGDDLELGRMVNPDTGNETEYEELWGQVQAESTTSENGKKVAVVLHATSESQSEADLAEGMTIRVGQYVQGLLVSKTRLALERWAYDATRREWQQLLRFGDAECELPCKQLFEPDALFAGKEVGCGGLSWIVKEFYEW